MLRSDVDARAQLEGVAAWLVLLLAPGPLTAWMDPLPAHAVVFAALAAWLTAARPSRGSPLRGLVLAGLAGAAGYLSAPAWMAGVGMIGLSLGWSPLAPAPPGSAGLGHWVCAVGLGPWLEELLYRERLLRALRPAGPVLSIGATSLLFALPHSNRWSVLAAGVLGLALGSLMWRSGALSLCIGYHAGLNLAALACGVPPVRWALAPVASAVFGTALLLTAKALHRRLLRSARCALALLCVPALAGAEALVFEGELQLEPLAGPFPALSIEGTGVATVNGSSGGIALESLALDGGISGSDSVPVTDPSVAGITGVTVSGILGAGTLRPFHPPATRSLAQLTRSVLPFRGDLRFCFLQLQPCLGALEIGLDGTAASGPVGVGVGGLVTAYPTGTIRMSLYGAPWTVRTASLPITTAGGGTFVASTSGGVHGPFSFTGSTALPGGEVQLVTPLRIETSGGGASSFPAFARLVIRFVPEPGRLLLLGAGSAAVFLAARRRGVLGGLRC
jgi:membrane protease YdiL (CAAX protease family)